MSSLTKGSCSSSGGGGSENVTFPSAFSRLSAGSVIRGGPEPPGWGGASGNCAESIHWSNGGQAPALQSLEGAVVAIHASVDAVEKLRRAYEEVSRENVSAAQAQVGQLDVFSETSGSWYWFHGYSQHLNGRKGGRNGLASAPRLLG
jgi:hypothetical protein